MKHAQPRDALTQPAVGVTLPERSSSGGFQSAPGVTLPAALSAQLQRMNVAVAGRIDLPAKTRGVLEAHAVMVTPSERAALFGRAADLCLQGWSVEETNPQTFAAHLVEELNQYLSVGATASPGLTMALRSLARLAASAE